MSKELTERERIYKALKRPFPENKISWRAGATNAKKNGGVATKCIALAYIDARDVMNRFDEVLGMDWQCKYSHAEGKTICDIGIYVEGEWIWRAGGAGDTDMEAEKGAISDAFKRAAVLFGVGRYLYELPNEWVACDEWKRIEKVPALPVWATPEGYDQGIRHDGYVFGEARKRQLEGIAEEVIHHFARGGKEQEQKAYEVWAKALPEFQINEEQTYTWFLLPSDIRSSLKRSKTINQPMKEAA